MGLLDDNFQVQSQIEQQSAQKQAGIARSATYKGFTVRKEVLDLSNGFGAPYAAPYIVNYPFKGVFVRSASDSITNVYIGLHDDSQINIDNGFQVFVNDQIRMRDLVAKGVITCAPQPGKTITLYFVVDGEFVSGSQLSITSGGVSVTEGSAFSLTQLSLTANAANQIFGQNSSRKLGTWKNETGAVAYIGTSTVSSSGTNRGLPVDPGATVTWRNSAALYAYITATGSAATIMEES